jgi:hypothetical protein
MKKTLASICALGLLAAGAAARAAPPEYLVVDYSTELLMDRATAKALWKENLPPQARKLYSPRKWGLGSVVEGGFNEAKTCVISARAMIAPLNTTRRALLFVPEKMAGTFDAIPNATLAQCKDLSRSKLRESIQAIGFAIAPR